jgi:hypothetical protein
MDEQYRKYFRERLGQLEPSPPAIVLESVRRLGSMTTEQLANQAARAARDELQGMHYVLREDGELVMVLLARELVARPVSAVEPREAYDLSDAITEDARLIVRRAAQEAAPDREVSAHRVIDGLSGVWHDLRSGRFNVWDRKWD